MEFCHNLKEGGRLVLPDKRPFILTVQGKEGLEVRLCGNTEQMAYALCMLLCRYFSDLDPVEIAATLGTIRNSLKKHKVMPDSVDMAVSYEGRVIPLDLIAEEKKTDCKTASKSKLLLTFKLIISKFRRINKWK